MKEIFVLKESKTHKVSTPRDLFKKSQKVNVDQKQENCIIFYLDSRNKIIDSEVLFKGGINACLIDPKVIFRKALLKGAVNLAMAHNHPSGDLKPSDEDKRTFSKLQNMARSLDLDFIDSIIFNETSFYSIEWGSC